MFDIKAERTAPLFNPIHLVLNSPEEVAKVYAIFNEPALTRALQLPDNAWERLRDINQAGGNPAFDPRPWNEALDKLFGRGVFKK